MPEPDRTIADAIDRVLEAEQAAATAIVAAEESAHATIECAREARRVILERARQRVIRLHERAEARLADRLAQLGVAAAPGQPDADASTGAADDALAAVAARLTTDAAT